MTPKMIWISTVVLTVAFALPSFHKSGMGNHSSSHILQQTEEKKGMSTEGKSKTIYSILITSFNKILNRAQGIRLMYSKFFSF